jgi:PAS domain-containing protein
VWASGVVAEDPIPETITISLHPARLRDGLQRLGTGTAGRLDCTRKEMTAEPPDQYQHLVESSPDGIVVVRNSLIEFLNPAATRLF